MNNNRRTLFLFLLLILFGFLCNRYKYLLYSKFSLFLPSNTSKKICSSLEERILSSLKGRNDNWSISLKAYTSNGTYLYELNGNKPRVPASNQKLLSTAFALDSLGRDFKLRTKLSLNIDGNFSLEGEGNPDLSYLDLYKLHSDFKILYKYIFNSQVKLNLIEISPKYWRPESWSNSDFSYSYAAPITTLGVLSNSTTSALYDPISNISMINKSILKRMNILSNISIIDYQKRNNFPFYSLWSTSVYSAPMQSLMSLANSESHNYTAEILLRKAANTWDPKLASLRLNNWLFRKGLAYKDFYIVDGSGLSRKNKVTSNAIIGLLEFMDNHKNSSFYKSTLSLAGVRGTLSTTVNTDYFKSKFYGKTGTLDGIRTVSGYLITDRTKYYVSLLSEDIYNPDIVIKEILYTLDNYSCEATI